MAIGASNHWHMTDTPSMLLCVFTNHINNMRDSGAPLSRELHGVEIAACRCIGCERYRTYAQNEVNRSLVI
jgi:hypothetical protein